MSDDVATKKDIEDLAELIREGMQLTATEIAAAEERIKSELGTQMSRVENKLDTTTDKVDDHEVRIGKLEHRPA